MEKRIQTKDLAQIALLASMLTVLGAVRLPSLLPGAEFQLSAPLAVAVCAVFGWRRYLTAGLIASAVSLLLGLQHPFHVLIALQFRVVVAVVLGLCGSGNLPVILAGPLGTLTARLTVSLVLGKAALALVMAALPGMALTALAAPLCTRILCRVLSARR